MARTMKTPLILDGPRDYSVIGEHLTDPLRLLVLGSDGHFYALDLTGGDTTPTELGDQWVLDVADLTAKLRHLAAV